MLFQIPEIQNLLKQNCFWYLFKISNEIRYRKRR